MAEGSIRGAVCNGISDGNRPARAAGVQLAIAGPKPAIVGLLTQPANAQDLIESGALTADGDISTPGTLASVMEDIDPPSTSRPCNQPQSGSLRTCHRGRPGRDQGPRDTLPKNFGRGFARLG